ANPAITGRVFMLIAFSETGGGTMPVIGTDLVAGATPLESIGKILKGGSAALPSIGDMFLGLRGGAMGETCAVALLLGFVYLVARRVIDWYVPATFVGTVFLFSLCVTGDPLLSLYEILAGGLLIGAIFMATDYVTGPINKLGRVVFAFGCGIITCLIRFFGAYPEGVSFAILFMNILSPYIEKWTAKRPLGGTRK
ncbi:MAG TPA: Na+-transporting NADH:ubiquinone oxidoreductase subunit D, partial [Clostridiales bacterium]|nr:Na+-transporting NADH:ubiquinone oxidoreductase subunit D [Clostridiales bacterium]